MTDLLEKPWQEQPPSQERLATARWLAEQGQRSLATGVSVSEMEALRSLLSNEGFGIFYSLLRFKRTEYQDQLKNRPLVDPASIARASVLQGHILALDELDELLLCIADPQAQEQPPEE